MGRMSAVTIYHNPACGTSRKALGLIRLAGLEPQVIEYLLDPPTRERLAGMIHAAGLGVREALREKGTPYEQLGLSDRSLTDDQLLDAMMANPILINRPFVVTDLGTRLCRPPEIVLDILPKPPFVAADAADLPAIRDLLSEAQLPVADIEGPTIRFWLARDQGKVVGTVALEVHGGSAMLRSLAVHPDHRGKGLGQALVRHAELCARNDGIQELCLLTTTAAELFGRRGYALISRDHAPEGVRRSEEFRSLCPDTAVCMLKRLRPTRAG